MDSRDDNQHKGEPTDVPPTMVNNKKPRNCAFRFGHALFAILIAVLLTQLYTMIVRTYAMSNGFVNDEFCWVGGVTATSAVFRSRAPTGVTRTFAISSTSDLANADIMSETLVYSVVQGADSAIPIKSVRPPEPLSPNTKYYYGQLDGDTVKSAGSFTTPAAEGVPFDFRVATAGCALSGSNHAIFKAIADTQPLMFMHAGDLHYLDQEDVRFDARLDGYGRVWGAANQRELFQSTFLAYMWDDHDYCGNNKNSECEGRRDTRRAYQKAFPHYTMAATLADTNVPPPDAEGLRDVAIYQAFTLGSVRFVVTDLRSEAELGTDDAKGSMYSPAQKAWLFAELANASSYDFVVWLTSKPWIGKAKVGGDTWAGFDQDRQELSDHISSTVGAQKGNLLVVSSDAHMVAFDDGTNTDYASEGMGDAGFPILHSGPLDNLGSTKGGPFSDGCHTLKLESVSQFSTIDFSFGGTEPCVAVTAKRVDHSGVVTDIFSRSMCGNIFNLKNSALFTASGQSSCSAALFSAPSITLLLVTVVVYVGAFV